MRRILNELGGHPLFGVLTVIVACGAFFTWEYLRLTGAARWSAYLPLVKRIAVIAAILSVVLMVCRFVEVEIP